MRHRVSHSLSGMSMSRALARWDAFLLTSSVFHSSLSRRYEAIRTMRTEGSPNQNGRAFS